MILIFGTRPYFRFKKVTQQGFCAHCDRFAKLYSFNAMRFFHLYYIPLIPTQGRRRNHRTCSKCHACTVFEPQVFENIINSMKEQAADAVIAVQNGESTFENDESEGEATHCVPFLHSVLDWLYASGNTEFCQGLLSQLSTPNCRYAHALLSAAFATMKGNLDVAIQAYTDAHNIDKQAVQPLQMRAHLLAERRRFDDAIQSYQSALAIAPEPETQFALNFQMVGHLMSTKRYADAVAAYEKILLLRPDLAQNASIVKPMKKAKKYAGVT